MPKLLVPSNFSTSNLVLVTIDLDENLVSVEVGGALDSVGVEVDGAPDSDSDISTTNSCHCEMSISQLNLF